MKKLMAVAVALVVASSAMAQLLPVAQSAAKTDVGAISATAAFTYWTGDSDIKVIGARCSYGVIENLLLVGDVGLTMNGDNNFGIGIAAQYTIPVELPVDLAVRAGYAAYDVGELSDAGVVQGMFMVGKKIEQVDGLAVYGGVGLAYWLMDGADTEILFDAGATYGLGAFVKNLSVFGEVTFATGDIPDMGLGISMGATYGF